MSKISVLIILLFIVFGCYAYALYYSATSAEYKVVGFELNINSLESIVEKISERKVEGYLKIEVIGRGPLAVNVRSLTLRIYMEGIYLGYIKSSEGFIIPSSGNIRRFVLNFVLDLSTIDLADLNMLISKLQTYEGEVKIYVEGYADVIFLFFTVTVPIHASNYFLLINPTPKVIEASWNIYEAEPNQTVYFKVVVKNPYRSHWIKGNIDVQIWEDVKFAPDKLVDTFSQYLQIAPGEFQTIEDEFKTYFRQNIRGFYIKIVWSNHLIYEMSNSYPPRLEIIAPPKPEMNVIQVYWEANGRAVSQALLNNIITLHVAIQVERANFQGYISIVIKKDRVFALDTVYAKKDFLVNIPKNSIREFIIRFKPDEPSSNKLRGYFVEVYVGSNKIYIMPDTYPPRLYVVKPKLEIIDVYWMVKNNVVTEAYIGDAVKICVKVLAKGGVIEGNLEIIVKKDRVAALDTIMKSRLYIVKIYQDESKLLCFTFQPDEASSSTLRGYYIEIKFNGKIIYTMKADYPPRLKVWEKVGRVNILDVYWLVNGIKTYNARVGQQIAAVVEIEVTGREMTFTISILIKKDIAYLPDKVYTQGSITLTLKPGEKKEVRMYFTPDEVSSTTMRGYFIEVWIDSEKVYTMPSSYPPRLKVSG